MDFERLRGFELKRGNHDRPEDGLCVLEAVAWFEGEPHSDHPRCVCPVLAHFCRAFNDRLGERRQDLVPYIPRLANTADGPETAQAPLRLLSQAYLSIGGSADFAARVEARFARARLPSHASSFALSVVCDAIAVKDSAADGFALLARMLALARPSQGFSTDLPSRARDLETLSTA